MVQAVLLRVVQAVLLRVVQAVLLEGLTVGVFPDTTHPNTVSCRTGYPFLILRFDNKIS